MSLQPRSALIANSSTGVSISREIARNENVGMKFCAWAVDVTIPRGLSYGKNYIIRNVILSPSPSSVMNWRRISLFCSFFGSFEKMMKETNRKPTKLQVEQFVNSNFDSTDEAVPWTLPDWQENPAFLERIRDLQYREWVSKLNDIWKTLARQVSPRVLQYPERHSIIPVDHGYIVPGGRFQGN